MKKAQQTTRGRGKAVDYSRCVGIDDAARSHIIGDECGEDSKASTSLGNVHALLEFTDHEEHESDHEEEEE